MHAHNRNYPLVYIYFSLPPNGYSSSPIGKLNIIDIHPSVY
ncbi:hypothetical protein ISN45_At03g005300 [Arabidopsis thaliana x Arabidopsis arenosa]|uniref:Uncharacterized protein n=2 Tax=Arabidopsis TaxID=3701 RepID=A0A8T2F1U8_ARASU|nr:hypothetical protein ISN45_At03g005300 [Arabidopsis thaliana x Arabidopsis arenosa]KAG7630157.1 hypothetical protein ISN44_As03g005270 [Arabidopsis suecica]